MGDVLGQLQEAIVAGPGVEFDAIEEGEAAASGDADM